MFSLLQYVINNIQGKATCMLFLTSMKHLLFFIEDSSLVIQNQDSLLKTMTDLSLTQYMIQLVLSCGVFLVLVVHICITIYVNNIHFSVIQIHLYLKVPWFWYLRYIKQWPNKDQTYASFRWYQQLIQKYQHTSESLEASITLGMVLFCIGSPTSTIKNLSFKYSQNFTCNEQWKTRYLNKRKGDRAKQSHMRESLAQFYAVQFISPWKQNLCIPVNRIWNNFTKCIVLLLVALPCAKLKMVSELQITLNLPL